MTPDGPIVIAQENRQQFCVHVDIKTATREAERLAAKLNAAFIVYVPVVISKPAPKVVTERIHDFDGVPF